MDYKTTTKYKDRLFCFFFGNEKHKGNTLSLYNALNGTDYSNEDDLELTTLTDVIYIRMRNDVSFLIAGNMSLYEHQSTFNPNMPLRGLLYFARLYDKYVTVGHFNVYGGRQIKLPTPGYVVFYNGGEKRPAMEKVRLSDAFINKGAPGEFEWTATVLNLNHPENQELLGRCRPLQDYTRLITDIKRYLTDTGREEAVDRAVTECIARGGELAEFLLAHRAEVIDMVLTEFDEEAFVKDIREEGLHALVTSLKQFIRSPQELYQIVVSNECYKDVTFDEVQALIK